MKKRRPCTGSQFQSPKNSPRPLRVQSIPIKSKSHHELKRRRQQRGSAKQKSLDHADNISIKKEVFGSLESLFDLKKPLTLPEIHSPLLNYYPEKEKVASSASGSQSPRNSPRLVPPLFLTSFSHSTELEPNIFIRSQELGEFDFKEDAKKTVELEEIVEDEETFLLKSYESYQSFPATKANFERIMADEENPQTVEDAVSEKSKNDGSEDSEILPPQHMLPPNMGEGISIKPGENRDSIMNAIPLTDTAVMKEMNDAYERCVTIGEEIDQLQKEMNELANKSDLSQEDTVLLAEKQENVEQKLAQLDEMTRKIQRLIGLSDPSSHTFATMFGMLPYPHQKKRTLDEISMGKDSDKSSEKVPEIGDHKKEKQKEKERREKEKQMIDDIDDDQFDLPQKEYPEDKLPRIIICGNTEDSFPKIVVADSQRKRPRTRHLENLTGKLSESLIMQEKLVKENAKLEGGKYKLEEAILEKDNAVDSLQRKVCGLQAEMRIVVKENTELSRQVACLNQKITTQSCCYSCPGSSPSSPLSTPALPTYSYSRPTHPNDSSCQCKCCLQENIGNPLQFTLGKPENYKCRTVPGTPRLGGGGTGGNYLPLENNVLGGNMSCRSPMGTKAPTSPRPPSRGTCPAELENNIDLYGQSTKHIEEQLGCIENEVRTMQMELVNVQRERNQLDQQRKLLKCTGPCAPCPCNPTSGAESVSRGFQPQSMCVPCPQGPQTGLNVSMPMKVPMKFLDSWSDKKKMDESNRYNKLFDWTDNCRFNNNRL